MSNLQNDIQTLKNIQLIRKNELTKYSHDEKKSEEIRLEIIRLTSKIFHKEVQLKREQNAI